MSNNHLPLWQKKKKKKNQPVTASVSFLPSPLLKAYSQERVSDELSFKRSFLSWVIVRGKCRVAVLCFVCLFYSKIQTEGTCHSNGRGETDMADICNGSIFLLGLSLSHSHLRFHWLKQIICPQFWFLLQEDTASHRANDRNIEFSYREKKWRIYDPACV